MIRILGEAERGCIFRMGRYPEVPSSLAVEEIREEMYLK